jgi:hypothetical protein
MRFGTVGSQLTRLVESASDELARLDALCTFAPGAVTEHLKLAALAQLTDSPQATPSALTSLIAAAVDPTHAAHRAPQLVHWVEVAEREERRARSGAPLTAARVLTWLPEAGDTNAPNTNAAELDDVLRSGGAQRAVLLRALSATAIVLLAAAERAAAERAAAEQAAAELLPALMLCAAGITDQIRLLPFADLNPTARAESLGAWRAGDDEPFAQLALTECARAARAARQSVAAAVGGIPTEEARLDDLGRASITARRALAALRERTGVTVPSLATQLECSRPAASDALERLVELHLAQEITGRGRDRVYIWSAVHRPA